MHASVVLLPVSKLRFGFLTCAQVVYLPPLCLVVQLFISLFCDLAIIYLYQCISDASGVVLLSCGN